MDPLDVHQRDQRDAAAREFARDLRVFWLALRSEGFPANVATRLTEAYLDASMQEVVFGDDIEGGDHE